MEAAGETRGEGASESLKTVRCSECGSTRSSSRLEKCESLESVSLASGRPEKTTVFQGKS